MLGEILSVGGSLLNAFGKGKGKGPTEVSGFASMPGEVKDYMLGDLLARIKQYGSSSYKGLPKRRVNADDMDPIFGNPTLPYLQELSDEKYRANSLADVVQGGAPDAERMQAEMNWNNMRKGSNGLRFKNTTFDDFYSAVSPENRAAVFRLKGGK